MIGDDGVTIQLQISAYSEKTTDKEIQMYGAAVKFMTYWLVKQDGVMGKDTGQLLDEFKENICLAMRGGAGGQG